MSGKQEMRWKKDCSWERNNASSVPASDPENARPPSWKHMNSNERPKDPSYLTPRTEKCARHLLCTCIFHRDTNEIALGKSSLDARYTSLPSPSPWNTTARAGIQQRNLAEILNKTRHHAAHDFTSSRRTSTVSFTTIYAGRILHAIAA